MANLAQVAQIEGQRVILGVPVDVLLLEAVVPVVVNAEELFEHVDAPVIDRSDRRAYLGQGIKTEFRVGWGGEQAFVGEYDNAVRVVDGHQVNGVEVDDLLQLVGDLEGIPARQRRYGAKGQILIRVGCVILTGSGEVSYDGSTEEVADEAIPIAGPGVENRARGPFAVELLELERLSGSSRQLRLTDPAGPQNPDEVDRVGRSQTKGEDLWVAAAQSHLSLLSSP